MFTDTARENYHGLNPAFYRKVQAKRRAERMQEKASQIQQEKDRRERERQEAARSAQESIERKAKQRVASIISHYREMEITLGRKPVRQIILETALKHNVTEAEILGSSRQKHIVAARHEAIWRTRKERPDLSFPQIGRAFGGLDHTTCLAAVRKMDRIYNEK